VASDTNTPAPIPSALLIDAPAARALLGIGETMLGVLTRCQAIPSVRVGRRRLYSPTELRAWIICGCPTQPGAAERVRKAVRQ